MMCGGAGAEKQATDDIKALCNEIRGDVEQKAGQQFEKYEPLIYRSQMVAGTNYFVKVQVGDEDCIHIRLFKPLPCNNDTNKEVFLHGFQNGKKVQDPVDYFENNVE